MYTCAREKQHLHRKVGYRLLKCKSSTAYTVYVHWKDLERNIPAEEKCIRNSQLLRFCTFSALSPSIWWNRASCLSFLWLSLTYCTSNCVSQSPKGFISFIVQHWKESNCISVHNSVVQFIKWLRNHTELCLYTFYLTRLGFALRNLHFLNINWSNSQKTLGRNKNVVSNPSEIISAIFIIFFPPAAP